MSAILFRPQYVESNKENGIKHNSQFTKHDKGPIVFTN